MSDSLEKYAKFANDIWHAEMKEWSGNDTHVFLLDLAYATKNTPVISKKEANKKPVKYDVNDYVSNGKCSIEPKGILPDKLLYDLFFTITASAIDKDKMIELANEMTKYYIEPTATLDIEMYRDNSINVLILGGGPAGLIMANYLRKIHNPKANVLLIDNRTYNDTEYRVPYTRDRMYSLSYSTVSDFWPQVTSLTERLLDLQIKHLEYILLTLARFSGVHIVYTKAINNQKALEKFVESKSIDIVYDCTGDRMKVDYLNKGPNIFKDYVLTDPKWSVVKGPNEYRIKWRSMIGRFYLGADYYKDGQFSTHLWQEFPSAKPITTLHDLNLIKPFHGKCVSIKDKDKFAKLMSKLVDENLRTEILDGLVKAEDTVFFYIIEPNMHHKINVAATFNAGKRKSLYIALGDTAFSSHFYIGAGLSRTTEFAKQVAWYQQTLYETTNSLVI